MAVGESIIQSRIDKVNKFTETEAAWLAAAIDGEGHIRNYVAYTNANGDVRTVQIKVNMTSLEFIQRVYEITGVGRIRSRKMAKSHWKPQWEITISGWVVVPVLEQILPWLIIKREKAIEIISEMEMKRTEI